MLEEIPGMKLVSDRDRYDPNTQTFFRETKWKLGEHDIRVNIDEYGYHGQVDNGTAAINMDRGGLISWIYGLFGRR